MIAQIFAQAKDVKEIEMLFQNFFTPAERETMEERVKIFKGLNDGKSQRDVAQEVGASLSTVSRGARELKFGNGFMPIVFGRMGK